VERRSKPYGDLHAEQKHTLKIPREAGFHQDRGAKWPDEDHRLQSAAVQYGGGTVQLWDRGYWEPEGNKTPEEALASGDFKFKLQGQRLHGSWVLVRMKQERTGGKRINWLLIKQG
jgi:ATP-dependent DNA ligase